MKKFLKLMALPLVIGFLASNVSCNASTAKVALITDVGEIDDGSFNQTSWEAIKEFCDNPEHPVSYEYYRPIGDSDLYRGLAIQQAVAKGAEIIVLPGFKFNSAVCEAQMKYPNTKFLLLDTATDNMVRNNVVCTGYNPEVSGYLGGYATATDYITYDLAHDGLRKEYKYGYCGGSPFATVYPFGYGFVQGLVDATADMMSEKKIEKDNWPKVTINFNYAGVFAQDNAAAARMKDWYSDDVKCVFACGGKLYQSITEGCKDYNTKHGYIHLQEGNMPRDCARWFGVDCDQYSVIPDDTDKKTIISSALKGLNPTIKIALGLYYYDAWDVIQGAYDTQDDFYKTKEEAETALKDINEGTFTANTFKGCETKIDGSDDHWNIMFKSKYDKDYITYHTQTKQWPLSLNSLFGRLDKIEEHGFSRTDFERDFVGLPVDGIEEYEKVLRGFYNFTLKQYNDVRNRILFPLLSDKPIYVYPGVGIDFYKQSEGSTTYEKIKDPGSNPSYMSESDKIFIKIAEENYISFNELYFNEYTPSKIHVNYI